MNTTKRSSRAESMTRPQTERNSRDHRQERWERIGTAASHESIWYYSALISTWQEKSWEKKLAIDLRPSHFSLARRQTQRILPVVKLLAVSRPLPAPFPRRPHAQPISRTATPACGCRAT